MLSTLSHGAQPQAQTHRPVLCQTTDHLWDPWTTYWVWRAVRCK